MLHRAESLGCCLVAKVFARMNWTEWNHRDSIQKLPVNDYCSCQIKLDAGLQQMFCSKLPKSKRRVIGVGACKLHLVVVARLFQVEGFAEVAVQPFGLEDFVSKGGNSSRTRRPKHSPCTVPGLPRRCPSTGSRSCQ